MSELPMSIDDRLRAEVEAEKKIQGVLLDLENETGLRVDWVRIDTRNFANCAVEISMKP